MRPARHPPQARPRLILLGVRNDLPPDVVPHRLVRQDPVPAAAVLQGLPPLRGGLSKKDSPRARHDYLQTAHDAPWLEQLFETDEPTAQRIQQTLGQHLYATLDDWPAVFFNKITALLT